MQIMTPTEKIDAALDSVLSAYGISVLLMPTPIDAAREAMRKVMAASYMAGSRDAQDAIRAAHDVMGGRWWK